MKFKPNIYDVKSRESSRNTAGLLGLIFLIGCIMGIGDPYGEPISCGIFSGMCFISAILDQITIRRWKKEL